MRVRVLPFGILKDRFGAGPIALELPEGATVADLLRALQKISTAHADPMPELLGIAVGVNAEYATASHVLKDGDEVALLPPVSGGSAARAGTARPAGGLDRSEAGSDAYVALVRESIDAEKLLAGAKRAEDGAVVVFDGIVRNHSRGRRTLYLDYEAYEEMALGQMRELAAEARSRFEIRHVAMAHRLGRIEIGESSVLIVVAAAHRAAAYEASRWLIDTLKQTVPIWKKETFADGAVWAPGEPFPESLALGAKEAIGEI